jgi:hypothetical protein
MVGSVKQGTSQRSEKKDPNLGEFKLNLDKVVSVLPDLNKNEKLIENVRKSSKPILKKTANSNRSQSSSLSWDLSLSLVKDVKSKYTPVMPKKISGYGNKGADTNTPTSTSSTDTTPKTDAKSTTPSDDKNKTSKVQEKAECSDTKKQVEAKADEDKRKKAEDNQKKENDKKVAEKTRIEIGYANLKRERENFNLLQETIRDLVGLACS